MMFHPVIPVAVLLAVAAVLSMVRMVALYRVLVRTGSGRYRPVVVRWSLLTVAIILLLVAAARPAVDTDDAQMPVEANPNAVADPNLNVFFVVDRSVNSRVEDYGDRHSRMTGIRSDISGLIDEYPHARFESSPTPAERLSTGRCPMTHGACSRWSAGCRPTRW